MRQPEKSLASNGRLGMMIPTYHTHNGLRSHVTDCVSCAHSLTTKNTELQPLIPYNACQPPFSQHVQTCIQNVKQYLD